VVEVDAERRTVTVAEDGAASGEDDHFAIPVADLHRLFHVEHKHTHKRVQVKAADFTLSGDYAGPSQAPIILLDKDSSEGISLMGMENVHLLEPLESVAERDQSLARAIRFQSHRHLPPSRHLVHVYTHIGVVTPSKIGMDKVKSMIRKVLFETERNKHINEQFAGVVPRAAKGSYKTDPVGYMFDYYWNGIPLLHRGFNGSDTTPDTIVLSRVNANAKHIGEYTHHIERSNVIYSKFDVSDECVADDTVELQMTGFEPIVGATPHHHNHNHNHNHAPTPTHTHTHTPTPAPIHRDADRHEHEHKHKHKHKHKHADTHKHHRKHTSSTPTHTQHTQKSAV
jgi:hypothetical protein